MTDTPTPPATPPAAPEPPAAPTGTGTPPAPAGTAAPAASATAPAELPPWERDGVAFDPARAWTLVQNLRAEVAAAKSRTPAPAPDGPPDLAAKFAALETQLARERVARRHSLPDDLLGLLGDGDEDTLTARATALIAWKTGDTPPPAAPAPGMRPVENLSGGAAPDELPDETDPAKLAAAVRARRPF